MTKQPLLSVTDLFVHFPIVEGVLQRTVDVVKAVDGVSFSLYPGEVLGVVGESGSGKSTAARATIRLIEPTKGSIVFQGQDLRALSHQQMQETRPLIQIVFQDPYASLNPRKTVGDSVGEALIFHGKAKSVADADRLVVQTFEKVGLNPNTRDRYPHQFSGGQQQRICIGRAIALCPKVLICDEAVSALDVSVQAQILNLLEELKDQLDLSYLFISHDLSVVRHIADRIVVMKKGKIVEQGLTSKVFCNPKHPYTQQLLSAIPITHPSQRDKAEI